jgi:hypothetical protein
MEECFGYGRKRRVHPAFQEWEVHGQRPCSDVRDLPLLSGKCNDPGSARELTHLNPSRL